MTLPEWFTSGNVAAFAAVIALLLSVFNTIKAHRSEKKIAPLLELQKKQSELEIQEREKALLEELSAKFRVKYEKVGRSTKLVVRNNGKCDATNVVIKVSDESPTIGSELEDFNTKVSRVNSMENISFIAAAHMGTPNYDEVTLKWDDKEKNGKVESFNIKTY